MIEKTFGQPTKKYTERVGAYGVGFDKNGKIEEVKEKLFLPHQIWAVEEIYKVFGKKA